MFRAQLRRALQRVPGKQRFGIYRFLPFFFVLGGTMEWIMIKVRVGQETFCFLPEMFMKASKQSLLGWVKPSEQRVTELCTTPSTKLFRRDAVMSYLST
uniref:Ubiquinol-cytochrome c reductase complex assembly factor 5 n=1 Tax=Rattus norvegicus TaxID=10116 RepID=A0A8I6AQ87_RAT